MFCFFVFFNLCFFCLFVCLFVFVFLLILYEYFFGFVNMGPNGIENSKPTPSKLFLNFPPNGSHKTPFGIFEFSVSDFLCSLSCI